MSSVLSRSTPRESTETDTLLADGAWRVMPGALMVCGWSPTWLPESGTARVPGATGVFRSVWWPLPSAGQAGYGFVAAIRLPARADPAYGASILLLGDNTHPVSLVLPLEANCAAAFGQAAAQLARAQVGPVADFMLDILRTPVPDEMPEVVLSVATMLRAFLSQVEAGDGCIEMTAAVPGACVALQGWGAPVTGPVEVLLFGRQLARFAGHAGEFSRSDVSAPATGMMLVLPPEAETALPGVDHVFILSERGVHSRTVVEQRLLDPDASVGHLRYMLPALRCAPVMAAMVADAVRPQFNGQDTISGHILPVRVAVDCVLAAPEVGVYLSGWIFDPRGVVASIHVCGTAGFGQRLDGHWTRIPRPDVSDAFANIPSFPPPPDANAGFAVFTSAAPTKGEALHLRVDFVDGDRAFLPLQAADPAEASARARLLAGIDMHKPSGLPTIERHLGPLMARVRSAAPVRPEALLRGPLERPHPVIVPLPVERVPRALLSSFLHDPLTADEGLIFVCGPEWSQLALGSLRSLLHFYGLPGSVLLTGETAVASVALAAAVTVTNAITLLLAGPAISGGGLGWREVLRNALRTGATAQMDVAFACPTLLYEDWSIRFAGAAVPTYHDIPPFTRIMPAMAGMSGTLVATAVDAAPVPAATGSLACCLLTPHSATLPLPPGAFATDVGREAAFFSELGRAGLSGLWVPSVQVYAPEDRSDLGCAATDSLVPQLVDGWVLREAWQTRGNK